MVITIAPVFLQGYNVLATAANACDVPATQASGITRRHPYCAYNEPLRHMRVHPSAVCLMSCYREKIKLYAHHATLSTNVIFSLADANLAYAHLKQAVVSAPVATMVLWMKAVFFTPPLLHMLLLPVRLGFPLPLLDVGYVRLGQDLIVVGAPARCDDAL